MPKVLKASFVREPLAKASIKNIDELARALSWATERNIPVIPRGSGSSGFGQTLPRTKALVLDLSFLNRILEVNARELWVRVETGVRWSDLEHYLKEEGLAIGSYPSSYYTTVGGWIATGGYGLCAWRFGHIKDQILELEILDAQGRKHTVHPGDDAFEAFIACEGQIGLLYAVKLNVRPKPQGVFPVLTNFPGTEEAMSFIDKLAKSDFSIVDLTYLSKEKMEHLEHGLSSKMAAKGAPLQEPHFDRKDSVFTLFENADEARRYENFLEKLGLRSRPASLKERSAASFIWFERFYPMKGKGAENFYLGNEVVVGLDAAALYAQGLRAIASRRALTGLAMEAHIIKGKVQPSCLFLAYYGVPRNSERPFGNIAAAIEFDLEAFRAGGRMYPIGIYKTPFLAKKFSAAEIERLKRVKAEFDPKGLFNPGKFFHWGAGLPLARRLFWAALTRLAPLGMTLLVKTASLLDQVAGTLLRRPEEKTLQAIRRDPVLRAAFECVQCGFCLPVCPAYLATNDEKTTARGKLLLYAAQQLPGSAPEGFQFSPLDAKSLQMCMHCAGCTKVCQSEIDLVPAWHKLEESVVKQWGQPKEELRDFVKSVEKSPQYHRLLREGAVVKEAPRPLPAGASGL